MYNNYKLVTLLLNMSGGESQTIEAMTKEVDGQIVPMTEQESVLAMFKKISSVGANPATKNIKCMLFNVEGILVKAEEVIKPSAE